jgi:hypothetical protein
MADITVHDGTSGLSRRKLLRNGLLLGTAVAGGGLASGALANVAQASTGGPQGLWAYCNACSGLFYYPNRGVSRCPGGGSHYIVYSYNYGLTYNDTVNETNPQSGWKWCGNCQGLFYYPKVSSSVCPAGGHHVPGSGSWNYALYHDNPNLNGGQGGWYWCNQCQGLFWGGSDRTAGICPVVGYNGPSHNGSGSDDYYLFYFSTSI